MKYIDFDCHKCGCNARAKYGTARQKEHLCSPCYLTIHKGKAKQKREE